MDVRKAAEMCWDEATGTFDSERFRSLVGGIPVLRPLPDERQREKLVGHIFDRMEGGVVRFNVDFLDGLSLTESFWVGTVLDQMVEMGIFAQPIKEEKEDGNFDVVYTLSSKGS